MPSAYPSKIRGSVIVLSFLPEDREKIDPERLSKIASLYEKIGNSTKSQTFNGALNNIYANSLNRNSSGKNLIGFQFASQDLEDDGYRRVAFFATIAKMKGILQSKALEEGIIASLGYNEFFVDTDNTIFSSSAKYLTNGDLAMLKILYNGDHKKILYYNDVINLIDKM